MKTPTNRTRTILFVASCFLLGGNVQAAADSAQQRRLFSPTPEELAAERKGQVFIYDSLHEDQVDQALDSQYGRIGAMMFVRTQHTTPEGETWEDHDCD